VKALDCNTSERLHLIPRKVALALGMPRYFTGAPCKQGHVNERTTGTSNCLGCRKMYNHSSASKQARKEYFDKNRERFSEWKKGARKADPEKFKTQYLADYEKNGGTYARLSKARRAENPEKTRQQSRNSYFKNLEANRMRGRKWARDNPLKAQALCALRRSLTKRATPAWAKDLTLFAHEEALSLARLRTRIFGFTWHVDHSVPLNGRGFSGLHVWYNLQVIPAYLNFSKGNKLLLTEPFSWLEAMTGHARGDRKL
jgi:hypothetical protein